MPRTKSPDVDGGSSRTKRIEVTTPRAPAAVAAPAVPEAVDLLLAINSELNKISG